MTLAVSRWGERLFEEDFPPQLLNLVAIGDSDYLNNLIFKLKSHFKLVRIFDLQYITCRLISHSSCLPYAKITIFCMVSQLVIH